MAVPCEPSLRLRAGKDDGNERTRLCAPRFSLADSHEAAAVAIQTWVIGTHGGVRRVASGFPIAAPAGPSPVLRQGAKVERALPNRTSRDGDGVDLTRRCSDRR